MGKFLISAILAVAIVGLAVLTVGGLAAAWLNNPAKLEYQRQADALALQRQAEESAWWRDVRESIKPAVILAGVVVALAAASGMTGAVGLFLARQWDERQKTRRTYAPDKRGLLPVSDQALDQAAALALAGHWQTQVTAAQHPQIPQTVTRYVDSRRYIEGKATPALPNAPAVEMPAAPLALPGAVELGNVLTGPPALDRVLIAIGPGGTPLFVAARDLCHVALTGSTGGGKSNLLRLLLAQLLAAGARVVLADPHYAPIDPDDPQTGDWRPIERRLLSPPAVSPDEIGDLLTWTDQELTDRLDMRRAGERVGPPLFLALDELPSIHAQVNGAADVLGRVVREGRKVGVFAVSSAQDFLVKSIGGSGAARDNFRTAYYVGGDKTSAAALLDVKARDIDDSSLGRGVVMLRNQSAAPTATIARVPLVSNESLYRLLPAPSSDSSDSSRTAAAAEPQPDPRSTWRVVGGAGSGANTGVSTGATPKSPVNGHFEAESVSAPVLAPAPAPPTAPPFDPDADRRERIRTLADQGVSRNSICQIIFGSKNKANMDYIRDALGDQAQAAEGD